MLETQKIVEKFSNKVEFPNHAPINSGLVFTPPVDPSPLGTYEKLNQVFTDQNEQQRTVLEAREILGNAADSLTDDQVSELVSEIQFLADTWLEEYEKAIFDGKTLNELLHLNPK